MGRQPPSDGAQAENTGMEAGLCEGQTPAPGACESKGICRPDLVLRLGICADSMAAYTSCVFGVLLAPPPWFLLAPSLRLSWSVLSGLKAIAQRAIHSQMSVTCLSQKCLPHSSGSAEGAMFSANGKLLGTRDSLSSDYLCSDFPGLLHTLSKGSATLRQELRRTGLPPSCK